MNRLILKLCSYFFIIFTVFLFIGILLPWHAVPSSEAVFARAATFSKEELHELVGTVAEDNIYVYPPGSYIVAAGEIISKEAIDKIIELKASGKKIIGL